MGSLVPQILPQERAAALSSFSALGSCVAYFLGHSSAYLSVLLIVVLMFYVKLVDVNKAK